MLRVLDLFSGIGGFSLGLERTGGFETVAFCEIDPFCRRVLAKHWPHVRQYEDVRELTAERLAADGIAVDVICGGFPCQDISIAATAHGRAGIKGARSALWGEYERIISELRPAFAIIENVDRLAGDGLDRLLRGIAGLGYDAEWDVLPASAVGAPQPRRRVWIVAYPAGERVEGLFAGVCLGAARQGWPGGAPHLLDIAGSPFGGDDRFPQPLLRGVDDRPAGWVDRLRALGNAVVPQIPELIGRAILASRETHA